MRITEKTLQKRLFANLQKVKERLTISQERIATQRNIRRPSDDPIGFMKVMSYHRELFKLRQTIRNAGNVSIELFQIDTTLNANNDLLLEARNIATTMSSDTIGAAERLALVGEMDLMIEDLFQKANTQLAGRYIFSGHKIFTQPYVQQTTFEDDEWTVNVAGGIPDANLDYTLPADAADADVTIEIYDSDDVLVRTDNVGQQAGGAQTYSWDGLDDLGVPVSDGDYAYKVYADYGGIEYIGDDGEISQKVALNNSMVVNVPGPEIFGTLDSGVFKVMTGLKTALEQNDRGAIQASISLLDAEMDRITAVRGKVGVKIKQVDASINELSLMEPMLTDNLSQVEQVNLITESGNYMAAQEAYEAALQATASILKLPKLLDYIR